MNWIKKLDIEHALWLSQILFFGPLFVCILIKPEVVIFNGGVSNYGNYLSTVFFYTLAFSLNILFLFITSKKLSGLGDVFKNVVVGLKVLCVFESLVLVSTFPRHFNYDFSRIHDYLGISQFIIEFYLALWITSKRIKDSLSWVFFMIQIIGSLIGLLSAIKIVHLLFYGQSIGAFGFGALLVFVMVDIVNKGVSETK